MKNKKEQKKTKNNKNIIIIIKNIYKKYQSVKIIITKKTFNVPFLKLIFVKFLFANQVLCFQ